MGQTVEGVLCELLDSGLAWVSVGGLELSARIPFEGRPGQRLLLQVTELEPEIVLKFVRQLHGSEHTVQMQAYASSRGQCELAWHDFLQSLVDNEPDIFSAQAELDGLGEPEVGEPLPEQLVQMGELQVERLYALFHERFLKANQDVGGVLEQMDAIRHGHIQAAQEQGSGVSAWAHIPWSSWTGLEKELLILRKEGQKLDEVFISGVWPRLGGALISAMAWNGQIAFRVKVQHTIPFKELVWMLNLGGLGAVLRKVKPAFGLTAWPQTTAITCLEYREQVPDSVAAMLLRLQRWQ